MSSLVRHGLAGGIGLWAALTLTLTLAAEPIATLRGVAIDETPPAPAMTAPVDTDVRKVRSYQIDLRVNKCLSCHRRTAVGQSQAPMVSITHFMDRDGQVLAAVTPRRYFCIQCHVPQHQARPLVANTFIDADTLIKGSD